MRYMPNHIQKTIFTSTFNEQMPKSGLLEAKEYIDMHNALIDIDCNNQGTVFTLKFLLGKNYLNTDLLIDKEIANIKFKMDKYFNIQT